MPLTASQYARPPGVDAGASIDWQSMTEEADARGFGAAVHAHRQRLGVSLNQLARRAGVDPAYIHRIESRASQRPPLPRRAVVLAIAAALELDRRASDALLAQAGYTPTAVIELGGWDDALATVAELLADPRLPGPAKAEFREVLRILGRRWGGVRPTHGSGSPEP
jgi:transcriptional regulator with XRE-family HTH domain